MNITYVKEKLEKAYNDEDWNIVIDLIEALSYEIESGDDIFKQYEEDKDLDDEDLWG